jgi:hypothetical protein
MPRTTIYKGAYFLYLGVAGAIALSVLYRFGFSPLAIFIVFVALLIPGRILGYFWRDLLRGLHLLNTKKFAESKIHSERFLVQVQKEPWLKNLIWLGTGTYSRDPEVLALNNLGAAEIWLGEFGAAMKHLDLAIEMDSECPLPYRNIAAILRIFGENEKAKQWLAEAERRGYKSGLSDRIVRASETRFAATR